MKGQDGKVTEAGAAAVAEDEAITRRWKRLKKEDPDQGSGAEEKGEEKKDEATEDETETDEDENGDESDSSDSGRENESNSASDGAEPRKTERSCRQEASCQGQQRSNGKRKR